MKPPITDFQRAAWENYQQSCADLAARISRELAHHTGLSEADYAVLAALSQAPTEYVRAITLRHELAWEKGRLSHQLRRMETRGLLLREECSEDNRSIIIRVTDTGRRLAAEACACYEQLVKRLVIDALTPEQLNTLNQITDTLRLHWENSAETP
ncbi:MAG: winged helix-turn-helix transcriptional regulator [Chloroflexi bacterium]|jgi:DNA-binding MarR family transcriptional regulator|nr:MarR family transcriptional regulator [Chloroflexota bacterium]MBV6437653.1 hypothetical protein [Anaerolineae bacterium]MDL1917661.1 winged helix-turn-helix transcriptional regulator [Anaerolineae bacterium CFX4]OQY83587.1 MAG: hypothetical protein B6D42_07225 [Anaerolineae bacterium UTCFX5]MBW7880720.1 winged helix-turn-helix transcriptional regulator [Anaerolineae bacterium]